MWLPRERATHIAATVSRVLAGAMALFGLFSLNFWFLLIAVFIWISVGSEARGDQFEAMLRGVLVRNVMNPEVHTIRPDMHSRRTARFHAPPPPPRFSRGG